MDPKENIPLSSAGSGGSAKSSLSMSAKSCKLSQKKCSPVENDSDINSVNPPADEKDRRENGSVSSGAKLGKETKKVPSLVSRVSDYLEDEESKASCEFHLYWGPLVIHNLHLTNSTRMMWLYISCIQQLLR
jgi:hypothetical protein